MELRHLRYFTVAGEELNMRRAAARLHVTPPAVSRLILDLEVELGAQLFERLPRGVRLTPEGRSFYNDARQMLHDLELASERVRRINRGQAGRLRLGMSRTATAHPVIRRSILIFHKAMPNIEVEFMVM